ncbi:hypothetical protein ACHAQH_002630 [Verticillium albo-atrum]
MVGESSSISDKRAYQARGPTRDHVQADSGSNSTPARLCAIDKSTGRSETEPLILRFYIPLQSFARRTKTVLPRRQDTENPTDFIIQRLSDDFEPTISLIWGPRHLRRLYWSRNRSAFLPCLPRETTLPSTSFPQKQRDLSTCVLVDLVETDSHHLGFYWIQQIVAVIQEPPHSLSTKATFRFENLGQKTPERLSFTRSDRTSKQVREKRKVNASTTRRSAQSRAFLLGLCLPFPCNTAKLHSPLFVQLSTDRVWHQDITSEKNPKVYRTVVNKRQEIRRRKKEAKRRRKVFNEKHSIYTPKPYTSKMLTPAGAPALDEHGNAVTDFKQDLNIIVECPDCREQPPNLVEEFSSGDMVCGSCGLVVGERIIDTRSEWRTFANDDQGNDDPSRVGDAGNPLLDGAQLETSIAFSEGRDHKNLARIQNKSQTDKNTKAIGSAFREISAFTDSINLGKNVADGAKHIYKLCHDHSFMKGKPQEALVAGCIFIACRQAGVGRTFREIYQVTNVSKKEIGRVFKALESFLQKIKETNPGGNAIQDLSGYKASTSTNAEDLCTRFTSQLPFRQSQKIENVSRALARKTVSVSELAGRSPLSVSAACIYMASHLMEEPKTSKDIAAVAGVSDGTIKTAYKFLYHARERLIEKEWGVSQKSIDSLPVN